MRRGPPSCPTHAPPQAGAPEQAAARRRPPLRPVSLPIPPRHATAACALSSRRTTDFVSSTAQFVAKKEAPGACAAMPRGPERRAGRRAGKNPRRPLTPASAPRSAGAALRAADKNRLGRCAKRPSTYSVWPLPLSNTTRTTRAISASVNIISSPIRIFPPSLLMSVGSPSTSSLRGA